jgi:hypothetical protein
LSRRKNHLSSLQSIANSLRKIGAGRCRIGPDFKLNLQSGTETIDYNKLRNSIATKTEVCKISLASEGAIAPLNGFISLLLGPHAHFLSSRDSAEAFWGVCPFANSRNFVCSSGVKRQIVSGLGRSLSVR